jgi:hypothetical protein
MPFYTRLALFSTPRAASGWRWSTTALTVMGARAALKQVGADPKP